MMIFLKERCTEEDAKQKYKAVLTVESGWLACEGLFFFFFLFSRFSMKCLCYSWNKVKYTY